MAFGVAMNSFHKLLRLRNRPHRVGECAVEVEASVRRPWRRRPPPMMHLVKRGSLWHVVAEPRVEDFFCGNAELRAGVARIKENAHPIFCVRQERQPVHLLAVGKAWDTSHEPLAA